MSCDLDEQHPRNEDGTWAAHCHVCGTYEEDTRHEPPIDYLCEACETADWEE